MPSLFKIKINRVFLYRCWRYFREGYTLYVTKPLGLLNFLTITFYLLIDRVEPLKFLLPHFYIYAILGLITLVPISILFGWLHLRKTKIYGTEVVLLITSNPVTAHIQRVSMENTLRIFKTLNVEPTKEWWNLYHFWHRLDEKMSWKP